MTATPTKPGPARLGRVAGLVLLGIAVVAAVIGVVALFGDGGSDQGGAPQQSTPPASVPGQPTGQQPSPTGLATPTGPQPPPPAPPAPPPPNTKATPVRVYNNGTVTGLAAQAARDFRADGWTVTEVDNYPEGIIPTTTVYFRPGTDEEAAARELATKFGMRAEPRFPGIADAPPGLIIMITNDYGGK
jgi:hypothetical protein